MAMRICSIEGCGKAQCARGWCRAHYERWLRHGEPLGGRTPDGEPLAFLERTVLPFDGDECLIWPYATNSDGYGQIAINGKSRSVTRIVCEAEYGPPPTHEHEAAHSCGKGHEGCCNRRHLRWATPKENAADKHTHGTHGRGCGTSKLTAAQVLEIRATRGSLLELAKAFGVSIQQISAIKARKKWAWLEDPAHHSPAAGKEW